jgi:hypothetical protein
MGTNDLAKEMGATLNTARAPFLGMLGLAVAAPRCYGLAIAARTLSISAKAISGLVM